MRTTSLFIEFLVTGMLFLLIITFLILFILKITSFGFLLELSNYWRFVTIFSILIIYISGTVLHRTLHKVLHRITMRKSKDEDKNKNTWNDDYYIVYNFGSENIVNKVEYYQDLIRLYVSIILLSPILGLIGGIWICLNISLCIGSIFCFVFILIGFLAYKAYRFQDISFGKAIRDSAKLIRDNSKIK